ncbi:MAE_28990/MAE_18760 family HEPN-like nuclease [Citrobacter amalonaticus]|uniref:MAE_28990/MAE_18760 family HEPN-like nuclease n=1 Tax=Citrobacter amalonaticus TaxID=35703 RepID=UPI0020BF3F6C|nr:MAE_28990/MAE_18760 family HEPN-like nuclease [Citrobacter amalonaticus]MCK8154433.1 MAE_28990/MAE_18760 family HEPN-like nuclease [Citrobacter amalonaticus]
MAVMNSKILFSERKDDIAKYFDFVKFIINERPSFSYRDRASGEERSTDIDIEMTHILKANAYIILYNLIEATISNAIEDIHEELSSCPDLCIDKVCEGLTKLALKKLDHHIVSGMDFSQGDVAQLILKKWLAEHKKQVLADKNPLFSGNVDAQKIRDVANIYGFSTETDRSKTHNGGNLVNIKMARNALAHGSESFLNKGQETSIDSLEFLKDEVFHYLEEILDNIEQYLDGQLYMRPPRLQA